ncbi:CoA transferase subunit A [Microbacterium sufflavum]|uniref:Acyl CoA--acetate/3-ketoacid CoA transferase subunit alpha n=1 Tax=Microbacterium sufflavum TaxID=2851649 RepID=A0ABY4IDI9_9MICO|nr:CoA-transferase [Microbacterium sufflavum]UPL10071.1 acyl CoA--acetate/3-ketoacid CoA transferase subunit alpha [Microbacterium sufflavum]
MTAAGSAADLAPLIRDGMTIGVGGWGSRRKPMALVRQIVLSGARDLRIVSFGGPDVGLLCATGQASEIVHGFVSLDSIAIDPYFADARQSGAVRSVEYDEAMLVAGLRAAARRLPFEATRAGAGSDAVSRNPQIRTITSPYADAEVLVAMPAVPLDLALLHLDRADAAGTAVCLGPDLFFDDLFAGAAAHTVVSVEEVVDTAALWTGLGPTARFLDRTLTDRIVHAPGGAGFTAHPPHHDRDEEGQRAYAAAAASPADREAYLTRFRAGELAPRTSEAATP